MAVRTIGAWRGNAMTGNASARAATPMVRSPLTSGGSATTTTGVRQPQQQPVNPAQLYRTGQNLVKAGRNVANEFTPRSQALPAGGPESLAKPQALGTRGAPEPRLIADRAYNAVTPAGGDKVATAAELSKSAGMAPESAAALVKDPIAAVDAAAAGAPQAGLAPAVEAAVAPAAAEAALAPAVVAPVVEAAAPAAAAAAAPIAAEVAGLGTAGAIGAAGAGTAAGLAGGAAAGATGGAVAGTAAGLAGGAAAGAAGGAAAGTAVGTAAGVAGGTAAGTAAGAAGGAAAGAAAGSWLGPVGAAAGAAAGVALGTAAPPLIQEFGGGVEGVLGASMVMGLPPDMLLPFSDFMPALAAGGEVPAGPAGREPVLAEGLIESATPGRSDMLQVRAERGSYIIPADVVSGVGEGNTAAGARRIAARITRGDLPALARGGLAGPDLVTIRVSGGEYAVSPQSVLRLGRGEAQAGAARLDAFVRAVRDHVQKKAASMPAPR